MAPLKQAHTHIEWHSSGAFHTHMLNKTFIILIGWGRVEAAAQVSPSGSFIHRILQMYLSRYNIWTLGQMSSDVRNAGQRSAGRHKPPSTFVSLCLSPLHALFSFLSVDVISCSAAHTGNSKCHCLCQRRKSNCFSLCLFVFFGPYFTSLPAEKQNRGAHCWLFVWLCFGTTNGSQSSHAVSSCWKTL